MFVPFHKPIIVYSTIRVDNGRMFPDGRRHWLATLRRRIGTDRRSTVAANNEFDAAYTRYFTGLRSVVVLPSFCGYVASGGSGGRETTYGRRGPWRPEVLVYRPIRADRFTRAFLAEYQRACFCRGHQRAGDRRNASSSSSVAAVDRLRSVHDLYPGGAGWSDLASHRAIVNLPVQPSMMSIFEQYRMNVPLFFPSVELLVEWEANGLDAGGDGGRMLTEMDIFFGGLEPRNDGMPATTTTTAADEGIDGTRTVPNPYDRDKSSLRYWLRLADWYRQLPYVFYYDSIGQLADMINGGISDDRLRRTSKLMRQFNEALRPQLVNSWREILLRASLQGDRTQR